MARMRLRTRMPGECLHAREINNNVLHPEEVPLKNKVSTACQAGSCLQAAETSPGLHPAPAAAPATACT